MQATKLGEGGAVALARALRHNTSITTLTLRVCGGRRRRMEMRRRWRLIHLPAGKCERRLCVLGLHYSRDKAEYGFVQRKETWYGALHGCVRSAHFTLQVGGRTCTAPSNVHFVSKCST